MEELEGFYVPSRAPRSFDLQVEQVLAVATLPLLYDKCMRASPSPASCTASILRGSFLALDYL